MCKQNIINGFSFQTKFASTNAQPAIAFSHEKLTSMIMSLKFTKAWSLSGAASVTSLSDVSAIWKDTFGAVTRRAAKSRSRPKTDIQIKFFFQIFRRLKLIFMI